MKPVRWSHLRWMRQSPLHYRYFLDNPIEETPAMRMGSIVHGIVLGSQHAFVVWEDARRGNAWKEFQAEHEGRRIITRDEYQRGSEVAAAILACPNIKPILRGIKEKRLRWQIDGRECEGTPDINGGILADFKVTADARPHRFAWHAEKMGWLGQLAWYRNGVIRAGHTAPSACYLVAAEPKPPYPVVIYQPTEQAMDAGERTWRLLWERLRACEASDSWPGYVESIVPLDAPDVGELMLTIEGEEVAL